jgi:methylase of polypeptide subunit release factors
VRGLSGSLFSLQFLQEQLPSALEGELGEAEREPARRRARSVLTGLAELGPASSVRAIFDRAAGPLVNLLGFHAAGVDALPSGLLMCTLGPSGGIGLSNVSIVFLVAPWDASLEGAWRDAVTAGIATGAAWALCQNGRDLRIVDARRSFSRKYLEFTLDLVLRDAGAFAVLWGLLRADAFARRGGAVIDRALALSDAHQVSVGAALECGVRASVKELTSALGPRAADQALTIVYRILFLLFAEARGLVPMWHPTYRRAYAIGALTEQALTGSSRGLWSALQATSRLAHAGCHAGELVVTPFNGRLFEPARTPLGESRRVSDTTVRSVLLALSTVSGDGGRRRVSYRDLGVEQLGAVYESVLDLTTVDRPATKRGRATSGIRKQTGSFYTPRSLTEYLVRRTLHPLIERRSAREILSLRILDLAMGSGAFLVAACRYLADACERALVRDGEDLVEVLSPPDRPDRDPDKLNHLRNLRPSAALRRAVARRCLFGVDLNPTAVQLGRLSLWLATLAANRPLTFLDHRLRDGDSLVGASAADLLRQPPGINAGPRRRTGALDDGARLFDDTDLLERSLGRTAVGRVRIAEDPDDTVDAVRGKERALTALAGRGAPLARWREVADLWCAAWFWPDPSGAPDRREYDALAAEIGGGTRVLPSRHANGRLALAAATALERRFLHWTLEFPEVFFDAAGAPLPSAGFDAILGNPPWEMLRGDHRDAAALVRFTRRSGLYLLQGRGHANLYQLFLERALTLLAPEGRLGLILPSSLALDQGSTALRRQLLERSAVDSIVGFENREAVFPIHRSLRFILLTATRGRCSGAIACRFGERDPRALDRIPDGGAPRDAFPVTLTPQLLARLSGDQLVIPEIRTQTDLRIAEKAAAAPPLGSVQGWRARFGRELNATDDAEAFGPPIRPFDAAPGRPELVEGRHGSGQAGEGLPIVEGKQLAPFVVDLRGSRFSLPTNEARARLGGDRFTQPRLAYRDVASAGNRLSLIAAIVPAGCVTTHTVFCLKGAMPATDQRVLCALLNSYVANFLVRQRIGTHLSAAIVERLPVPRPARGSIAYADLERLTCRLEADPDNVDAAARAQARAAALYGLTEDELSHVLDTFPLVPADRRAAVLSAWRALR